MSNLKLFTIIFSLILIPLNICVAAPSYNAGFVSGLWYSKVPFFSGETIRIYAAFQNHSGGDITGVVEFFDNGAFIGRSNFSAISDRLVETWIDWKVSYGNHVISAKIVDAKRSVAGQLPEKIEVSSDKSESETVFSDKDTDQDGIGDLMDLDTGKAPLLPAVKEAEKETEKEDRKIPAEETKDTSIKLPLSASSIASSAANTSNNFVENFIQGVDTQREEAASSIKNIDEMYKKIDTDHDGSIGLADFNILMVNWNKEGANIADYNQDEIVDLIDFNILMIYWT